MIKFIFAFAISLLIFSCQNPTDAKETTTPKPPIIPIGGTSTVGNIQITVNRIFWYAYKDYSFAYDYSMIWTSYTTLHPVIELKVTNNTGGQLYANMFYSWGSIIDNTSGFQLDSAYSTDLYPNYQQYSGTILPSASIIDQIAFKAIPSSEAQIPTSSFRFMAKIPYKTSTFDSIAGQFEVDFTIADIGTVSP